MGSKIPPAARYLLDTSAFIAYLGNENGGSVVSQYRSQSVIPFIVLSELYYVIWRKKGRAQADFIYGVVKSWKLPMLLPNERVILTAGRFKGEHRMGIADSYIGAFANTEKLILVTKDRDFKVIEEEVQIQWI